MNEGVGTYPRRRAGIRASDPAIHFEGRTHTYGEFAARVNSFGLALQRFGFEHGDRIAYVGFNHPALLEVFFAANLAGFTPVLVNPRLTAKEIAFILADSGARAVVFGAEQQQSMVAIREALCNGGGDVRVEQWIAAEGPDGDDPSFGAFEWLTFEDVIAGTEGPEVDERVADDDVALIMYTSGTTGRPKGAMLTHRNLLFQYVNSLISVDARSDEVHLAAAPLFHIAGLNMVCIPTFMLGGQVIIHRSFRPAEVLADIKHYGVTSSFMVPAMLDAVSASPEFGESELRSVRSITVGGSPLTVRSIRPWQEKGVHIAQGFGMTETSPGLALLEARDAIAHAGTAGRPQFFSELRVVDPVTGEDLPDGSAGEVLARGPQVMKGYWNRPEATEKALAGGWYHTGDIAVRDADGYYTIKDRIKDMYISGGENVYPAEVENALQEIEGVKEAAVIGVPDKRWGESGKAFVVVDPKVIDNADCIRRQMSRHLAKYKIPRDIVVVDDLPRTTTGKIRKNILRSAAAEK